MTSGQPHAALIVDAVRTPLGKRGGALSEFHPVALGAHVLEAVLQRAGVEPDAVQQVLFGCVSQVGEQSLNVARNAVLMAGWPIEIPGTTLDFQCGSSQQAVHLAASQIQAGVADLVVAGGVESMSRVPLGSTFSDDASPSPPQLLERYPLTHQGISAQHVAWKYGVTREAMDEFSLRSHQRAAEATEAGHFDAEILPLETGEPGDRHTVGHDEGIRTSATLEAIAALRPAFHPDHDITAGNASQLTDGAAAVLLASPERARDLGLVPRARVAAHVVIGCDPVLMLEGPIPATAAVLEKAGLTLAEIDLFEVNEAFAAIPLAWLAETGAPSERTNVNGGAIALGHPVGATGARLITTILAELERRDLRYGLVAMCCGGGLGTATIVDRKVAGGR
jgi:acetyl-CoA acetyltransferase family protein